MKQVYEELKNGNARHVRLYICSGPNDIFLGEFRVGVVKTRSCDRAKLLAIDLHKLASQPKENEFPGGVTLACERNTEQPCETRLMFRSNSEARHHDLLTAAFPAASILHEPNSTSIYDDTQGNNRNYTVDFVVRHRIGGGAFAMLYVESKCNVEGKLEADLLLPAFAARCGWHVVCIYKNACEEDTVFDYTHGREQTFAQFCEAYKQSLQHHHRPVHVEQAVVKKRKQSTAMITYDEVSAKRIKAEYIKLRCQLLHGLTIEAALKTSYVDSKGKTKLYTRRDLNYDLNKGIKIVDDDAAAAEALCGLAAAK